MLTALRHKLHARPLHWLWLGALLLLAQSALLWHHHETDTATDHCAICLHTNANVSLPPADLSLVAVRPIFLPTSPPRIPVAPQRGHPLTPHPRAPPA